MQTRFPKRKRQKATIIICAILAAGLVFFYATKILSNKIITQYQRNESIITRDRNNEILSIPPNQNGYYAIYEQDISERFAELLIQKEDKFFYWHPGINPISALRAAFKMSVGSKNTASSTLTQQLVKILRHSELDRGFKNKIIEALYAISIEAHATKKEILNMYANSVYFGNQAQGITAASELYFNSAPQALTDENIIRLLATIPSPSLTNPFMRENGEKSEPLAQKLNIPLEQTEVSIAATREKKEQFKQYTNANNNAFEFISLPRPCAQTTIDSGLNMQIRDILKRNLNELANKNAFHGAVVVIKHPENEILALIGSARPESETEGDQINMALQPRPIGSTVKPFIYLKGFEQGLRPYTLVDDKEYKYTIGSGYAFYPKNYDYKYRGPVTLHYALSNSLNVPTIKTLEYVGLENFYQFLTHNLGFEPIQPLENYQLGIALGELESDLLTLTYYFTIFDNDGWLKPLAMCGNNSMYQGQTDFMQNKQIADTAYIQLINKILTDRQTGVEQFGVKNNFMIPGLAAAVKTGTSREYHDSWIIGYVPDFTVGVWVGNAQNSAMDSVSGEPGAGKIWHDIMQLLRYSEYYTDARFAFDDIKEILYQDSIEYGLSGDNVNATRALMQDNPLIISPHQGDTFLFEKDTRVILKAREPVSWYVDDEYIADGAQAIFQPTKIGARHIQARAQSETSDITIYLNQEQE
ncbi:hypothetical protein BK004_01790 [bacterium CG10_46_32]|nr:MAG: hypothetical protein AUJ34_03110 [Parcubacteria group bacterium CG1_02_41_12]OJI06960.1 MAG: hypothetical protein BK004_01790 [bacterium CG10_46_32]PIR56243.1 MAG: hypothetical protein COU73_01820 [Parcubacteria group bacterium CG10_big_fil_rev_8_21_14_0_10_46_32]PJC40965.1 MAG: hypothetical protein CO042_00945 [Parcubacteria group bacterium CG_4_9_14_0_2_um_filter_41_8]